MKFCSLKRNKDFSRVYRKGIHAGSRNFVVYLLNNRCKYTRLGISASKKVGCAVKRNRVRRIVKEAFSQINLGLKNDIVVVARSGSVTLKTQNVICEILGIMKKITNIQLSQIV